MPPEVRIHRLRRLQRVTASTIASTSSRTKCIDCSRTPRSRSRRVSQAPLASVTLAVRTSLPMITAAAPELTVGSLARQQQRRIFEVELAPQPLQAGKLVELDLQGP